MAAPSDVTINNLQGTWRINKALSDGLDVALELRGIPWLIRKAVSLATITDRLSQRKDENGATVIQVAQSVTGGRPGETEVYIVDGSETTQGGGKFGVQKIRTRWLHLTKDVDGSERLTNIAGNPIDPWLLEGWLSEGTASSPGYINVFVVNEKAGWTTEQVWGFSEIEGARRRVTKFIITKGPRTARVSVVYDWLGRRE
ncbi:hypothetical protein F5Y08DRAFT_316114 [Xylaria arbuscula]|nr:hypothetical protein F5Y08DRAFT_316114 [Xylaria arbuscula]